MNYQCKKDPGQGDSVKYNNRTIEFDEPAKDGCESPQDDDEVKFRVIACHFLQKGERVRVFGCNYTKVADGSYLRLLLEIKITFCR